ncbi:hypothetical protein FPV16_15160 [Methylobacterium sp. W2]|uniref:hypothetical protein n=1 Tax=Methylobacterium sp. W2 TaxID=2598107 RepID=UPI001D0C5AAA|nr:hypothetical protein [Methylobacterium sp. W2]MCC0807551.1 hypothetical protein [Methylobacterium sp. W2]
MYEWQEAKVRRWFYFICVICVLFGLWFNFESYVCPIPSALLATEAALKPSCFEFWLNRYQTIIGAGLALVAAWIATIPARGQLLEMSKQSAATARQSALDLVKEIEVELELVKRLRIFEYQMKRKIKQFHNRNSWPSIYVEWLDEMADIRMNLNVVHQEFSDFGKRYPFDDLISLARLELNADFYAVWTTTHDLNDVFRRGTRGPKHEEGEDDISIEEVDIVYADAERAIIQWGSGRKSLEMLLQSALESKWLQVRTLERQVLGG